MPTQGGTATAQVQETQLQAIAALAFNYYQQGRLKEAETLFRGLAVMNPKAYYSYAGVGAVALARKPPNLTEAYENLSKAAELNPSDPSVQTNLGEVLLRQAKFKDAAGHFKKALDLDPQKKDPGANRAQAIISGLTAVAKEVERIKSSKAAA